MEHNVRRQIALKLKDSVSVAKVEPVRVAKRQPETVEIGSRGDGLRWNHPVHIIGRPVKDPLLHICEICSLPILIYGRMKKCRHVFCHDCSKKALGVCPQCKEGDQSFDEATMGNVYICTHGGGRYDNKGCRRSYLSQRDLDAHIVYRHKDKSSLPPPTHRPSNTMPFPMPPFFQPPNSVTGLHPGLQMPPTMVIPGLPPQGMPGLPLVPGAQFMHNPQGLAGAPPPPPPSWAPPPPPPQKN